MLRPIAWGVMLACSTPAAGAPTGPQVAAGAATFQSSAATLNVTNAPGTVINWQSFSIGHGETTRFIQPSAASAVLNRVVGPDASSILGTLSSNGRVFLVNPHGILFGAGAVVDTAGFIASTLNITDSDFLRGNLKFEGGGAGVLRNEGRIRASGEVVLVGPRIENTGLIVSEGGSVLLAAGRSVTVTSPDAQGVRFAIQAPEDSALNLGSIEARNSVRLFAGTLRHSGYVRAGEAALNAAGQVELVAGADASMDSGARIVASGGEGGRVSVRAGGTTLVAGAIEAAGSLGRGGSVEILGERVGLTGAASVDASGAAGGGTILVGGDFQGANPDIRNARQTFVGANATLRADAGTIGEGGRIIVWADEATRYYGQASARGGAQGGDGGLIEVSGKRHLDFRGLADTRAPQGRTGTLLLDPTTVNFVAADDALVPDTENFASGRFQETGAIPAVSEITVGRLRTALATSDVVVTTESTGSGAGDINFETPLDINGLGLGRKLTLVADRDVNVRNAIFDSVAGGDTLNLVLITAGATNVTASIDLGDGVLDASRDGSRIVNVLSGPANLFLPGTLRAGTLNFASGPGTTAVFSGAVTADAINLSSGTLRVAGAGLPRLNMTGGVLEGPAIGALAITGPFTASGGAVAGSAPGAGNFVTRGATTITGTVGVSRDWTNEGTLALGLLGTATGRLDLQTGYTFRNTGTLNLDNTNTTPFGTNGAAFIVNAAGGVFSKNAPGTSNLGNAFENAIGASVYINAGDLRLPGAVTQMGDIEIAGGAALSTNGNSFTNGFTGVIGGSGTINVGSGALINQGALRPGARPGPPGTNTIGTLSIEGNLALGPASVVNVEVGPAGSDRLTVSGNAALGGSLNVAHRGEPEPEIGATFNLLTYGSTTASSDFAVKNYPAGFLYTESANVGDYRVTVSSAPFTHIWGGAVDFAWENVGNWNTGAVPGPGDNVVIPDIGGAGATHTIIVGAAGQRARKLTSSEHILIEPGASLALGAGSSGVINAVSNDASVTVNGTLDVAGNLAADALTVVGGRVEGPGRVSVTGALSLNGASIATMGGVAASGFTTMGGALSTVSGPGVLEIGAFNLGGAGLTVGAGGLLFLGAGAKTIGGGATLTVENSGVLSLAGALVNNGTLVNAGTIEARAGDASIASAGGFAGVFNNTGTIEKLGAGTLTIGDANGLAFTTSGRLDALSAAGSIVFDGINAFQGGTQFVGPGAHRATRGGAFTGVITSNGLTLETGTFTGTAFLGGTTTWTGGAIEGEVTIPLGSTLNLFGDLSKSLQGAAAKLTNNGTVNISGTGHLVNGGAAWDNFGVLNLSGTGRVSINGVSTFTNRADGFVHSASSSAIPFQGGAAASFSNLGTLNKNAGAAAAQTIELPFANAGIVNARSGTLRVHGGGTDTGTYALSNDATFEMSLGTRIFEPAVTLALVGSGKPLLSGGVLDVKGGSLPRLDLSGGALTNSTGTLTISGPFNVSGGAVMPHAGGGELVTSGATIVTGVVNPLRNWVNSGTLELAGGGQVSPSPGLLFTFTNLGTVNINNGAGLTDPFGTIPAPSDASIVNSGVFNKNAGADVSTIAHAFSNGATGTINVNAGTLSLSGMPVQGGRIRIAAGAAFDTGGNNLTNQVTGEIGGLGTLALGGAPRTLFNSGRLIPGGSGAPGGGTATGTFTIDGNLTQGASGTIEARLAGTAPGAFDRVAVAGSAALDGTLGIATGGGYVPAIGESFTLITSPALTGSFAVITRPAPFNEIIPAYNATDLTLTLGPVNRNTWLFDGSGLWTDTARWSQNRAPIGSDEVVIDRPAGVFTVTVPGGAFLADRIASKENLTVLGRLGLAAASTIDGTLTVTGGTLQGAGPITVNGTLALDAATLAGAGAVTVNGTTTVSGGASNVTGRLATNGFSMTGGTFGVGAGGVLDFLGAGARVVSGAATTFSNAGTVNLAAGTLTLGGGGTDTGAYTIPAGASLDLTGGTRNFNAGISLSGAGMLNSSATLNLNAPLTLASGGVGLSLLGGVLTDTAGLTLNGVFNWAGGSLTGAGTLTTGATATTSVTGTATLSNKLWENFGAVALAGTGQIVLGGAAAPATTFLNRASGVVNDDSASPFPVTTAVTAAGKFFSNAGVFNKNAGALAVQTIDAPFANTGRVNVRAGTLQVSSFPTNNGIIDVFPGATFSTLGAAFANGLFGTLTGNGTFAVGAATLINNGMIVPGDSPGTLTIAGNFTQGPGGVLAIELGGTTPGTQHDRLAVTGIATLGGTLSITMFGGYTGSAGDVFDVMTYGTRVGDFAVVSVPATGTFQTQPNATLYRVVLPVPPVASTTRTTATNDILTPNAGSNDANGNQNPPGDRDSPGSTQECS